MQIPPAGSAASAAGIVSQSTAKDKDSAARAAGEGARPTTPHVEQSGESNPDRDAQGQGDGLGERPAGPRDEVELSGDQLEPSRRAPSLPDEPDGELDLLG